MRQGSEWRVLFSSGAFSWARMRQIGFSIADQGFSVGGMFLVNVALARTQSKEEYGIFALSYSVFTFLAGLHNAAGFGRCKVFCLGGDQPGFSGFFWVLWGWNFFSGVWGVG